MDQELIKHYGSIQQAANAQSAYLHDLGLFHAEIVIDELVKQRDELMEALESIKIRVDSSKGINASVDDVFDSFYCDYIKGVIENCGK